MGGQSTRLNILKKKIILGFKSTGIYPCWTLKQWTRPNSLYIIVNQTKQEDDDYQSNQKEDGQMDGQNKML
jgi:hypothetical protein